MISETICFKKRNVASNLLKILLLIILFCLPNKIFSQKKEIYVRTIEEIIVIDGESNEKSWTIANEIGNFVQWFPTDSLKATNKTNVKIIRDKENIYLLIKSAINKKEYVIESLRRDWGGRALDGVSFTFDTFNDNTNAYFFGVSPAGTQRESLVFNGGNDYGRDIDSSWDMKWYSEAKIYENYILTEVKIPLKFLNFPEATKSWGFNIYRFDSNTNERTVWSPVSRNQFIINLAFLGKMVFEDPLGKWVKDEKDDRLLRQRKPDDAGPYYKRYSEGIDNDGDGKYNEDWPGGIDPNRNYPGNWSVNQRGSGAFPGSEVELRSALDFIYDHPNIAASQSLHSTGGVILRPPSVPEMKLPNADLMLYMALSERGLKLTKYGLATSVYQWNWPRGSKNTGKGQLRRSKDGKAAGWKHYYKKSKLSFYSLLSGQGVIHMGFSGFMSTASFGFEYNLSKRTQIKIGGLGLIISDGTTSGEVGALPFFGLNFLF